MGIMKYFRQILIGHEKFFNIFDRPQNIFLCSIFVVLFFKLSGLEHKILKQVIKEIFTVIIAMVAKRKKHFIE